MQLSYPSVRVRLISLSQNLSNQTCYIEEEVKNHGGLA